MAGAACGTHRGDEPPPACDLDAPGAPWLTFSTARSGNYDVALVRADGTCERLLTTDPGQDLFPTASPAGRIAFASDRGGALGVWIHDLRSGAETPLDVGPLVATYPAWSPDGASLAFEGSMAGTTTSSIYVVRAAAGSPVRLTDDPSANGGPVWSPDGASVYFVSNRTGAHEIFSVPAAGGAAVQVTSGSRILGRPALSPDNATLAWARTGAAGTEIVAQPVAGGAVAVVSSQGDSEPAFQPGVPGRLVLRSYRYGAPELVLVDAAGAVAPVRVTSDGAGCGGPAFLPSAPIRRPR